ncbi:MAG: hypothetical protein ACRD7E_11040 [Bryobacteraceae bacterium]
MKRSFDCFCLVLAGVLGSADAARASGHGPAFGHATPTNPKGGWSVDLGLMGRHGGGTTGSMMRAILGYGITEDVKVMASAPAVFQTDVLAPGRVASLTSMQGDFEGIAQWRFHRQDTGVGSRFESTVSAGVIVPGPQEGAFDSGPGIYSGVVTGFASRSHYLWGGVSYSAFLESEGDRRPGVVFYSAVYGYRPQSWRTDYPRWDWRLFGEFTGERTGAVRKLGVTLPGTEAHQMFFGPSALGVYKAYAVSAGIQFPVYRSVPRVFPRERFRWSVNFAYFF